MKTYLRNITKESFRLNSHLSMPGVFAAMSAGLFLLTSCGGGHSSAAGGAGMKGPQAAVSAVAIEPAVYDITERFPGTLEANSIVQLRSDVTGYLEAIKVPDGSMVRRGQALYEIDKSRYQAFYNQAKAALQQAEADLAQKRRDMERYQDLLKHDAIARQVAEQAGTAVQTAEANVAAAKASLSKVSTDLDHAVLRASTSGKLGIAQAKIGDIINAGQTVVNTIVNDDPMYADFDVPQSRNGEFAQGAKAASSKNKYYLKLADSSVYQEAGKLLVVNNTVNPGTGTIRIRLQFPNHHSLLKSGMNAVILLRHASDSGALAVPTKSLVQTLAETSVLTVDKNNVVQVKQIEAGVQLDSLTLIEKGLQPGDRVIVNGLQKVRPGDTVQVTMIQ